jgi:hypothetical protein
VETDSPDVVKEGDLSEVIVTAKLKKMGRDPRDLGKTSAPTFIERVIAEMPNSGTLKDLWERFNKTQGKIQASDNPDFSTSANGKTITFNPQISSLSLEEQIREVTHEISHVLYKAPREGKSYGSLLYNDYSKRLSTVASWTRAKRNSWS